MITLQVRRSTAVVLGVALLVAAVLALRAGVTAPDRAAQAAGDRYRAGTAASREYARGPEPTLELGRQYCSLLEDGAAPGVAVRDPALMAEYDANRMSAETRWRAMVLAGAVLCPDRAEQVLQSYWRWLEAHT